MQKQPQDDLRGQIVKNYRIDELIGSGGTSVVYRAYQSVIEREVAIKVILPAYANHVEFIRRFEREARIIARLEHPYIVPLYDYWREPGGAYLVMRLLRGGSLADRIVQGPLSLETVAQILEQVADALTTAHQNNIVHHDLKPSNLLMDEQDHVFLADFGIARNVQQDDSSEIELLGSIAYLSPEQIHRQPPTRHSDIFSLGLIVYEMLTGKHPFPDTDRSSLMLHLLKIPLPLLQGEIARLNPVIQQATAKTPEDRFENSQALAHAFRQALGGDSHPATIDTVSTTVIRNPYKGLHAFQEADAGDFFGRERLVEQLLQHLDTDYGPQLLAVVGPSGSGKSSVVRAGLIPALRGGALPGTDRWLVAEMSPGDNPFQELAAALLHIAVHPVENLLEQIQKDPAGLMCAIDHMLPDDDTELLLFIDQFEELFTLAEDEVTRQHFLNTLVTTVTKPFSRVHVVLCLRADFYDLPLQYPEFATAMRPHTEIVIPMTLDELEQAIVGPATQRGLILDLGLVATIIKDVREQPGTLPLLQYALTELFEHRRGNQLTLASYQSIAGVSGSLARRAETIYAVLLPTEQDAARQVFLRLVTLGEGTEDTRRRVQHSELASISIESTSLERVLELFGRYRLLTFDHEPSTRVPTVEIAHEALIKTWGRFWGWINDSRDDLRLHRRLAVATGEWLNAGRDTSFLAAGVRLEQFDRWASATPLVLTEYERQYLQASTVEETKQRTLEMERKAREAVLERRSQYRLRALVMLMVVAVVIAFILMTWALNERASAKSNADNAATGAAIARRSSEESQSLAWATSARQSLRDNNPDLAIVLALEANRIDQPPFQAQQALAEAVYSAGTVRRYVFPYFQINMTSFAVGPDGRTLLIGHSDRTLRLWDMETGQEIREFPGHDALVYSLAYSSGGRTAIAGTGNGILIVWDVVTGAEIIRLLGHQDPISAIRYAPSGRQVASASRRGEIILWNLDDGDQLAAFSGHSSRVTQLDFSLDGRLIVSGALDGTVRVWDILEQQEMLQLDSHQGNVTTVAFSPDNRTILSGGSDNSLIVWDVETGLELHRLEGHTGVIHDSIFSEDGRTVLSGAEDGAVIVWDVNTGEEIRRLIGHNGPVWSISPVASGDRGIVSLSADGSVRVWDIESGAQLRRMVAHGSDVTGVAFAPSGQRAISASLDRTLILWDLETGESLQQFTGHTDWILAVAISPDSTQAISGSLDRTLILWDLKTNTMMLQLLGHSREVIDVAFSPDGNQVLSGSADHTVRLWDTTTGDEVLRLVGHSGQVWHVAFSPDGSMVASASIDGSVRLWDATSGELLQILESPEIQLMSIAFSPDGRLMMAGSADARLYLWNIASGQELRQFIGHNGPVVDVAFSPNGKTILSASTDRSLRLWDVSTGDELARFDGHTAEVTGVAFSPDGRSALSASRDSTLRLWRTFRSLQEMMEWAYANRYVRPLSCEEREKYLVTPYCGGDATLFAETPLPIPTILSLPQ